MEAAKAEKLLDLRGVRCPHVVLRAKTALAAEGWPIEQLLLPSGEDAKRLAVIEDAAYGDAFSHGLGHRIASHEQRGDLYIFRIIKRK